MAAFLRPFCEEKEPLHGRHGSTGQDVGVPCVRTIVLVHYRKQLRPLVRNKTELYGVYNLFGGSKADATEEAGQVSTKILAGLFLTDLDLVGINHAMGYRHNTLFNQCRPRNSNFGELAGKIAVE